MAPTITKFAHLQIPLEDIVKATNNFHHDNLIGYGGFGPAYKGLLLRSEKSTNVSVLRLDRRHGEGDVEFWTEVSMLSDLNHKNLVSIIGFCDEKNEKIIVTTYVAKGSLKEHLSNPNLTWTQRLTISVGVARALSYLHRDEGRGYGVIHRNINTSTVLLDENWDAKLSGFKISLKQSLDRIREVFLSEPIGTMGYMDPEIEKTKGVTHKSDTYAFGVVLFEILCGRKAFDSNEAHKFLAPMAKYHYENKTLNDIILPGLCNQMSPKSLVKYSEAAYSCINDERVHRPDANSLIDELEKALEFQLRYENTVEKLEHLKIRLSDIKLATDDFSETRRYAVYCECELYGVELKHFYKENHSSMEGMNKGEHPKTQNPLIMIRHPSAGNSCYEEEAFLTGIEMLSHVKHPNIITLFGFCIEGSEMILIIENFCLYLGILFGDEKLLRIFTWEKRLKSCIDVAHALNYLHYEMKDQKTIINRDITSSNIVLDENFGAKIVNFSLSVFLPPNQEDEALYLECNDWPIYTDPEHKETRRLKRETDVYSFGVVLFEILCGKKAYDGIYTNESDKGLTHVAKQSLYNGTFEEMIDPIIRGEKDINNYIVNKGANKDSLHTFIKIAHQCIAETQDQRPTIKVVLKELKKALTIQENPEQEPDIDQVVNRFKKTLELQLTQTLEPQLTLENIPGERVQDPNPDQVTHKVEKASELQLKHAILEKKMKHLKIQLSDIKLATDNFSKTYETGYKGSYYTCYRVELGYFNKENHSSVEGKNKDEYSKRYNTVLLKRYHFGNSFQLEEQFFNEIEKLTSVEHSNIVTLHGFCFEGQEMILVTNNVSNGYLFEYLGNFKDMRILTWEKRLNICIDIAHALNYLHYEMKDGNMIIDCNINSGDIGLDENHKAKIFDLGQSSIIVPPYKEQEGLHVYTKIGTQGYIDPEFVNTVRLKREFDVYGFGIILFQILFGRTADDTIYMMGRDKGLVHAGRKDFFTSTIEPMVDPIIKEETHENNFVLTRGPNKDSLHIFYTIAYECVADTQIQDQRPTMKTVVRELEKSLFYQKNNKDNPRISLEDINRATQNFHNNNCIGRGGFGRVYRGNLQNIDGCKIVVAKRLDKRLGQGEQQFLSELQILIEYKHENIIGLVGYCDEKDEKIIVCEYASKGSLDRYLNNVSLTWVKRLNICIDVATALDFIHGGVGKQAKVIHRDIKTENILINHDWKAKLADFGLSLKSQFIQETDFVIDHACGTPGYLDPLYQNSGLLTIESDIYSFGVVLFEILYGRSTYEIQKHEGYYLPNFVEKRFEDGKHDEVVFEQIREHIAPKSLTIFQEVAYQCLHHEREKRPTTKHVLMQLKKALEYQNMASIITKLDHLRIPLEVVTKATNNFHDGNIIRHDDFGKAYKGEILRSGKLMKITAQRFDCKHREGDLWLLREISVLSELKHTNLTSLVGFCDDKDENIIVTTYEENGSLVQYLDSANLPWTQRLRICVGIARLLCYLHYEEGRDYAIIHCNISSDTILLDENWEAKLSGFEIYIKQLLCYQHQVWLCEHIGTKGFMDPAIEQTGGVTLESDIYSFGVVLFEILCGRKALLQKEANRFLAPLAKYHYENETLGDIVHVDLYDNMSPQSLLIYSEVAYSCLNENRADRPDINSILRGLELALQLQLWRESIGKSFEHLKVPLDDIITATHNFSDTYRFECNDCCSWYRVELKRFEKENHSSVEGKNKGEHLKGHDTVVIKRYPSKHQFCGEIMFYQEIEMLTGVKHPNIATLLGFCVEGSEMIVVIENVSNGHLGSYFENVNEMRVFTWEKRLRICIDVAHALNYLHTEMEDQKTIINRDINSYNIVLDENLRAKIINFWISVYLLPNQEDEALYMDWIGIPYYLDPEYKATRKLKRESDIYSFGVVMFEILCGRIANDPVYLKESHEGLGVVAKRSFSMGTIDDIIDPVIKEEIYENNFGNKDSLQTFVTIANQCLAETQDQRPTMKVVIKELQKALILFKKQCGGCNSLTLELQD